MAPGGWSAIRFARAWRHAFRSRANADALQGSEPTPAPPSVEGRVRPGAPVESGGVQLAVRCWSRTSPVSRSLSVLASLGVHDAGALAEGGCMAPGDLFRSPEGKHR